MSIFRMGELIPLIQQEAITQGVDPEQAVATFVAENTSDGVIAPDKQVALNTQGIDPETGKPSGAVGLFQVTPTTLTALKKQGWVEPELDYSTLQGQIRAGVAAVKEAFATSGGEDPLAGAAQYVNGTAGLAGYNGAGPMPPQAVKYLEKFRRARGMSVSGKLIPTDQKTALDSAMSKYAGATADALPMLRALGIEMGEVTQEGIAAAGDKAAAEAEVISATAEKQKNELNRDLNLLNIWNLQDQALIDANAQYAAAEHQVNQVKPVIDSLNAINPAANPVKWIAAQFQLGALTPQYDAAIENRARQQQQVSVRQAQAAAQKALTPAVTLGQIEQERQGRIELSAAQANLEVAKMKEGNIYGRAKLFSEEMQFLHTNATLSAEAARLAAMQLGFRQDISAKKAEQDVLNKVNLFRATLHAPEIPSVAMFKALPKDQQEFMLNGASGGTTPGTSMKYITAFQSLPGMQRDPNTQAMGDFVAQLLRKVQPKVNTAIVANPRLNEGDAIEKEVNAQYKSWKEEVSAGFFDKVSDDNPYKMVPSTYAKAPGLEKNEIAKYVKDFTPSIANLGVKDILAYGAGQVKAGRDYHAVAKDISEYFTKGYEYQFKTYGMGTLGFDSRTYNERTGGKPIVSYAVSSDIFGWMQTLLGNAPPVEHPIQLMSQVDVERFLLLVSTREAAEKARQSTVPRGREKLGYPGVTQ